MSHFTMKYLMRSDMQRKVKHSNFTVECAPVFGEHSLSIRGQTSVQLSDEQCRLIVDSMDEGIVVVDERQNLTFVNPAFARMLGYVAADILGHAVAEFVDDATRHSMPAGIELRNAEDSQRYEQTWLRKNGTTIPTAITLRPTFDREHRYSGSVRIISDLSDLNRTQGLRDQSPNIDASDALEQGHAIVGLHSARTLAEEQRDFNGAVYSAVQRASLDGILLVDSQQKIISYNQRFIDIWGIPPELIASKSDTRLLEVVREQVVEPEAFAAQVKALYARIDEISSDEIPLKDGRTLNRYSAPVSLDDGSYIGRVWFFRDVTESRVAKERMREDATQFRALVEQQIAGIYIVKSDGTLAYVNPRFVELLGYTPSELLGRPFIDVVADKDKAEVRNAVAEHWKVGPLTTQTVTAIKRKDGELVDVLAHASLASYQGKPALIGLLVDITAQKRATDLLRTSEERFRLLVEQAPDAIVIYDVDADRFVDANKSATALFGCSRDKLLEVGPLHFFLPDLPDEHSLGVSFEEHNKRALAGLASVFERRFRDARGSEGTCEVTLARLPTITGRLLRGSLVDITERRKNELALAYRDRVLHAVTLGVAVLVAAPNLAAGMPQALQTAAKALQVDRILILERCRVAAAAAVPAVSLAYAWQAAGVPVLGTEMVSRISAGSEELDAWLAPLLEGKPVISYAATSAGVVGQIMREMHNLSTLLVPIVVAGKCWGHLGVDDCEAERQWTPVEIDTLVTLAQVIGGLIVREQAQASLQYSEERFRVVSDTAQDAIVMVNSAAKVVYWNRAAEHIFGYSASEAIGRNALEWLAPPRYREKSLAAMHVLGATGRDNIIGKLLKIAAIRKGGLEFPIELSVASVLLRSEWHAVATIRDITERKKIEEQITYLAGHDSLTGLVNRTVFVDVLQQAIARANRGGDSFAVFYIDLDHFKDINDTLGHPIGDLLLQSVADRVRTSIRGTDTVARFGGDEFALIQAGVPEPIDAAVLASKLLEAISEPFTIRGNEIRSGASIGIAVYGPDSPSAEILLSRADVALYRAKSEGRGTYRLFNDAMDVEVQTRVTLGGDLRDAMASGQLFLMYQPQIDIDTGCFVGVEALARWHHPIRGLIPPGVFIPVAEQSGQIVALGRWVLQEACRQMKDWIDAGIAPPLIAVNVSGLQFKTPFELENEIAAILTETGLPPQRLELELTESVLMDASREHNDALLRLRKIGHRIAIDDFGTGYSSLEYLGRFPVDRLKIAESFVVDLTSEFSNSVIVKAAIGLARELNLDVVVEGVQTAEQLKRVRSWGCRNVQGYYFSKPLRAPELTALLRAAKIVPAAAISESVAS